MRTFILNACAQLSRTTRQSEIWQLGVEEVQFEQQQKRTFRWYLIDILITRQENNLRYVE